MKIKTEIYSTIPGVVYNENLFKEYGTDIVDRINELFVNKYGYELPDYDLTLDSFEFKSEVDEKTLTDLKELNIDIEINDGEWGYIVDTEEAYDELFITRVTIEIL